MASPSRRAESSASEPEEYLEPHSLKAPCFLFEPLRLRSNLT